MFGPLAVCLVLRVVEVGGGEKGGGQPGGGGGGAEGERPEVPYAS